MSTDLTALQRVQRSHVQIMAHKDFCLYSGVLLIGDVKITNTRTAYTDGKNVCYGGDFIGTLTDKEVNFVVLHENAHKAYRHLHTWKNLWKINPSKANRACDYVINLQLRDMDPHGEFLTIWPFALIDDKYRGMNAKEVFDLLDDDDDESSLDDHDWEASDNITEEEIKDLEEQITDALRQGAIMVGKKGGNVDRSTKDFLTPVIDWREQLREFVISLTYGKDQSTWARVNRRFIGQGIYMPGTVSESVGPIVLAGDTSGSIVEELRQALGETEEIMKTVVPERVDLLWWDSRVAGHEVYLPHEYEAFASMTVPVGGGGTVPSCINQYMAENKMDPEAVIIFTDGCVFNDWGDFSEFRAKILWVIIGNRHARAPSGKTINIG